MKILIVEDETSLRNSLIKGFHKYGYAVDAAADGEDALRLYAENFYNAVILDLNLPKIDGMEVLKTIRESNKELNIIILSARAEIEDKITGLDSGANDYLSKPFNFAELEARLRALLRRKFIQQEVLINFYGLQLNTAQKTVLSDGNKIPLTKKEYCILEYLLLHKDKVISAEDLVEHIWEEDADLFLETLKVHINSLRKKLSENSGKKDIIKNVRGIGYYIGAEVL